MKARFSSMAFCSLVVASVLSVGCASLETATSLNGLNLATEGTNVGHMHGRASGLYFLPWVPLLTGNTDNPNTIMPVVLQDTASLDGVADMISAEAKAKGAAMVLDMTSSCRTTWIFPTLVLFWKSADASANAVR